MRILQLTITGLVALVVLGVSYFAVETLSGGLVGRWHDAPFTGKLGDEFLAIELATVPLALAILAAWGTIRLFRMRSIHNEIDDSLRPFLTMCTGYARFLLIIVSGAYLIMGNGWTALSHLVIALIAWVHFYRSQRAQEGNADEEALRELQSEEDEDPSDEA